MTDGKWWKKDFIEQQQERDSCGFCDAPKIDYVMTEAGVQVAVCLYHQVNLSIHPDDRDRICREKTGKNWDQVKEDYREVVQDSS